MSQSKQRVMIVGPSFFGYCRSIADGFESLGWESRVYQYDEPVHPFNFKNKLLRKLSPSKNWLLKRSRERVNREVIEVFNDFLPQLLFVYNGDALTIETVLYCRQQSKVAVWLLDGAYKSPRSVALAPYVDAFFCFEKSDLLFNALQGTPCYFLPQGFDPSIYHPVSGLSKEIDILFVGALFGYPERISLLKALVQRFSSKYTVAVYGVYKPLYKMPLQWLFREHRSVFKNRAIPPHEVNILYNSAKVCLNIHHSQSKDGANPKVFEIAATGAFQVVDRNPFVVSLYNECDVKLFDVNSSEELLSVVEQVLEQRLYLRSTHALLAEMEQHTFSERIKQALSILYP